MTLSEILFILEDQIRNYGGTYGVRDINLLSSAIYMPQSSFDGEYLHKTIPAMAATYAFHICQNHPFIDGNKRTALASSLVFLDINEYTLNCKDEMLYNKILNVAKGEIKKEELIKFYERYSKEK
ncbi:type II toxin-antitoxin system death-on-curing family toxin [Treponema primitia]|uniref:type II toxin-antitoxin system death-on-curing family toxin n=1 Tax=Treponema primitia TaxID=88058 RepID=UPI001E41E0D8|nr:type II toxin-antitoxin system death-on-curing family toxin [Treponema primitia]